MPASSPRDTIAFPLAAALWAAGGSLATSAVNVAMTLGRFMGDDDMPDVLHDLLPGLVGQGLLGAILLAVLVFLVAERRQARAPDRVGHARGAAAITGLSGAFGAWIAVSIVSALAFGHITALQSPAGFAIVGAAMSVLHLGVAALCATVGAVLLPRAGASPAPPTRRGHAWVGVAVFGAAMSFGVDLVLGLLPGVLDETIGSGPVEVTRWSPLAALLIGGLAALGYGWRRTRTTTALAWSGDALAALAVLPLSLAAGAGVGALALAIAYLMSDASLLFAGVAAVGILLLAGIAFSGLGALAGLVRTLGAPRDG
ncbi:hypothetical protein GCM10028794_00610 [Silanimonas algicola]